MAKRRGRVMFNQLLRRVFYAGRQTHIFWVRWEGGGGWVGGVAWVSLERALSTLSRLIGLRIYEIMLRIVLFSQAPWQFK